MPEKKKKNKKPASPVTLDLPNFSDSKNFFQFRRAAMAGPGIAMRLAHDRLTEAGVRKVGGWLRGRPDAGCTATLCNTVFPDILRVVVVPREGLLVVAVTVVVRRLLVTRVPLTVGSCLRKPVVVTGIS